jgi:hypothetical protein
VYPSRAKSFVALHEKWFRISQMPQSVMEDEADDSKPAAVPVASAIDRRISITHVEESEAELGEIPFLLTHWLDGLTSVAARRGSGNNAAIQSIRSATATLASAFESLGSFGRRLVRLHVLHKSRLTIIH